MKVICVIGDLVDSRKTSRRAELQTTLQQALEDINRTSRDHLLSPCTITLGDEYQAVYRDAGTLFTDFCTLLERTNPERVRFSVGVGALSTPVNPERALGMDGPAFHVAREAMQSTFKRSGSLFSIRSAGQEPPAWMEPALALVSHEVRGWKATRFSIFRQFLSQVDPKGMAKDIGITQTAVYKNIQSGALEPMMRLLQEVAHWLDGQVAP